MPRFFKLLKKSIYEGNNKLKCGIICNVLVWIGGMRHE